MTQCKLIRQFVDADGLHHEEVVEVADGNALDTVWTGLTELIATLTTTKEAQDAEH